MEWVVIKCLFVCSYYGDRDGASPARDYPKPWLDFLYDQRCDLLCILESNNSSNTFNRMSKYACYDEILLILNSQEKLSPNQLTKNQKYVKIITSAYICSLLF